MSPGGSAGGTAGGEATLGDYYVATDGNDSWSGTLSAPNAQNIDGPWARRGPPPCPPPSYC